MKYKCGKFEYDVTPADGAVGFILKNFVDGSYFFRVYDDTDKSKFKDYDLVHSDLEVIITKDALASFYEHGDRMYLDNNPETMGWHPVEKTDE